MPLIMWTKEIQFYVDKWGCCGGEAHRRNETNVKSRVCSSSHLNFMSIIYIIESQSEGRWKYLLGENL